MSSQSNDLLEKRKKEFAGFLEELIPCLVDFVGRMGITPAHEVLNHAVQFAPYLGDALKEMAVTDSDERSWLLARMAYFIGEYFSQKYSGCWFVNESPESRYFCRYVVGQFAKIGNMALVIDPFDIAQVYVDMKMPRNLKILLDEVDVELSSLNSQTLS